MLIFLKGQYTLTIVQETLSNLGLKKEEDQDFVCELKQDCRHVFFIPVFPVKTYWEIKTPDGQEIINYEILDRLEGIEKKYRVQKLPSWSGTLFFLSVVLLFAGHYTYTRWEQDNEKENLIRSAYEKTMASLKSPSVHDYYTLDIENRENKQRHSYVLKVNRVLKDSIQLVLYDDVESSGPVSVTEFLVISTLNNKIINSFWVRREQLVTLFADQKITRHKPVHIVDANSQKITLHSLEGIETIKGPLFEQTRPRPTQAQEYILINNGFGARLDSLKEITGNVKWKFPKGVRIHYKDTFSLVAEGRGKAILYCSDSSESYQIDLTNEHSILQINGYPELMNRH